MKREKDQQIEDQTLGQAGHDRDKDKEAGKYGNTGSTAGNEESLEEDAAAEQQRKEAMTERD